MDEGKRLRILRLGEFDYADGLNEFLSVQAWREGQNPLTTPSIGGTLMLSGVVEDPAIRLAAGNDDFSAELRWLAFMADDRMPVHIPVALLRLDCNYSRYVDEFGFFNHTDPTVDVILNIHDIDCSDGRTIGPLVEQIGFHSGDANFDGNVSFVTSLR